MHLWHDISPGENAPEVVTAVIEIPSRTRTKYELDKQTGLLKLDRVLYSSIHYPANYGFVPQTYCLDNDPLDIIIVSHIEISSMCLVDVKVIGVMTMTDEGEEDDKIIGVVANDRNVQHMQDIDDVHQHFKLEMRNFFETYKELEGKKVEVTGFDNRAKALEIVAMSIERYKTRIME